MGESKRRRESDPNYGKPKQILLSETKSTIRVNGENITLKNVTKENVQKYFNVMKKLSLLCGDVPTYNHLISPQENLTKMLDGGIGMKWEIEGDWNDTINGVFDQYMNNTFEQHIFNTFNNMIYHNVNESFTVYDGKSYSVEKKGDKFSVFSNDKFICSYNLRKK
jgi:hypothetical protein